MNRSDILEHIPTIMRITFSIQCHQQRKD